jgi:hypothetical protein
MKFPKLSEKSQSAEKKKKLAAFGHDDCFVLVHRQMIDDLCQTRAAR